MGLFTNKNKNNVDSDDFVNLIQLAKEDINIRSQIIEILELSSTERHVFLDNFIIELKTKKAPADFIDIFIFLKDDDVADKVYDIIKGKY